MTENAYRKVTEDELEYERRESRFRYQLQRNTELYLARKEGRSEGESIGLEKGAAQKQREIARNMKNKQLDFAVIAEITGLSTAEIEKL